MVVVSPIAKWLHFGYRKTVNSIAFVPALIALFFLMLSVAMIAFDFSETGKSLKASVDWISLHDADTARSICTTIAGGIFTLAVFSFTMVMLLLSQYASQMSNRILGELIGNRFQQMVLGFYIGTIIYVMSLLSAIRDIDSGIYVPALSTYLLILLTIIDIFLFIYFLHYITDAIKYETIISRLKEETRSQISGVCLEREDLATADWNAGVVFKTAVSGRFQGFNQKALLRLCENQDFTVVFLHPIGTFLLKGSPILRLQNATNISKELEEQLLLIIQIGSGQNIDQSYYYGFRQLMEIAIKALSPGINDPDTAIICLHALADLLSVRLQLFPDLYARDASNTIRIVRAEKSIETLFKESILPIWDYGKKDRLIQDELHHILTQLLLLKENDLLASVLIEVEAAIALREF